LRDISADVSVEQMKSEFVAAVSHELRTPLTSIYGFAETLLRQDVLFGEDERRTFLGYIASESNRLTSIVDALLNVARLDTGDRHRRRTAPRRRGRARGPRRGDRDPEGRARADLSQVLPGGHGRPGRGHGRQRARPLHRARPRRGDGRADRGRLPRGPWLPLR